MRLTNKLYAQHIGWYFKKHWQVQGRRVPKETGAIAELLKKGITVKTADEVLHPKTERQFLQFVGCNKNSATDHLPNWRTSTCHAFNNNNILFGGLEQAQVLTNTLEVKSFPPQLEHAISNVNFPKHVDRNIQNAIFASHLLDAQQVKLPKIKLIDRPAFVLPRLYGIAHERRNHLLLNKLLFEIEKLAGRTVSVRRKLIDNITFRTTVSKDNDLFAFNITGDKLISSCRALETAKRKIDGELPDLYPLKCTISMQKQLINDNDTFSPLGSKIAHWHPHTVISFFDERTVSNVHGSEVTKSQFYGRTLLKAFVVAVSRAKELYGVKNKNELKKPIVVQSIQTDGRSFHFGVFQLNTLNLNSNSSERNYWFHSESVDMFNECCYKSGRPHIKGYNSKAFQILNAFYHNT